ncbi:hypothetical protein ACHAWC_001687 [Mediolabrus comicus]
MDKLLSDLRNDSSCQFICLYGEYNSSLLTIKTRKRSKMNNGASCEEFTEEFTGNLQDESQSPRDFAEDYRKSRTSLTDSSNGKIVTNDEARRKFGMFPEFLGGDDAEDMN